MIWNEWENEMVRKVNQYIAYKIFIVGEWNFIFFTIQYIRNRVQVIIAIFLVISEWLTELLVQIEHYEVAKID